MKNIIKKIALPLASKSGLYTNKSESWKTNRIYIKLDPTVITAPTSSITIYNPPKTNEVCIEIGEYSHIFSTFAFLKERSKIKIGKRTQLGMVSFNCADYIEVGDDVLMAWGITIMDNDSHSIDWEFRKNDVLQCYTDYKNNPENFLKNKDWSNVKTPPIIIRNKVWIGFNATILKGVSIGEGTVIGACRVLWSTIFLLILLLTGIPLK
jgi:galactoside O-acetyltransferase